MSLYRIVQRGWEGYTGDIGQVSFKDGVTVTPYPQTFIDRVAASFQLLDIDTGGPAGLAQRLIDAKPLSAPVAAAFAKMTDDQIATANAAAAVIASKSIHPGKFFSQDELAAVVDQSGIGGLREIAQPYGVKAKSINDLMTAILKAQDIVKSSQTAAAPATPVVPEPPVVAPVAPAAPVTPIEPETAPVTPPVAETPPVTPTAPPAAPFTEVPKA